MPCFHPLTVYRPLEKNINGTRPVVFKEPRLPWHYKKIKIACSQCIGCRLERSRQWAMRCLHEASLYENNCFITLTFSDQQLASDNSLHKADFQKFIKRLRKRYQPQKIRYFHCGEYGDLNDRPHHHACLFNFDFNDRTIWKETNGIKIYTSQTLEKIWQHGYCTVGDVTFESAAYVARYILKKINGHMADKHYETVDKATGEIRKRIPEYTTMSRRPGIGKGWFDKFKDDVYPDDFVIVNGKKCRPPKFYDSQLEQCALTMYEDIKSKRESQAETHIQNNTPERLKVREYIQERKLKLLPRKEI